MVRITCMQEAALPERRAGSLPDYLHAGGGTAGAPGRSLAGLPVCRRRHCRSAGPVPCRITDMQGTAAGIRPACAKPDGAFCRAVCVPGQECKEASVNYRNRFAALVVQEELQKPFHAPSIP